MAEEPTDLSMSNLFSIEQSTERINRERSKTIAQGRGASTVVFINQVVNQRLWPLK